MLTVDCKARGHDSKSRAPTGIMISLFTSSKSHKHVALIHRVKMTKYGLTSAFAVQSDGLRLSVGVNESSSNSNVDVN